MEEYLNKIHLGDSLELMKLLPDNCVDLIVTDPPYIVDTTPAGESRGIQGGDINKKITSKYWEDKSFETKPRLNLEAIKNGFDSEAYFNEWDRVGGSG